MPFSDKYNLIMTNTTAWFFFTVSSLTCAFLSTAEDVTFASWFYQNLSPLSLCASFLSLPATAWVMICSTRVIASDQYLMIALLAGALLTFILAWNVTEGVQNSCWLIIGIHFYNWIFRIGWRNCRYAFHADLYW